MATSDDLQVLEWFDAIRRRPTMYLGDTGHLGLFCLARELIDLPLDPREIWVTLDGRSLEIRAACVSPSREPRGPDQLPFLVEVCTRLTVPLDRPPTLAGVEHLDDSTKTTQFVRLPMVPFYLAIANALSTRFFFESMSRGTCWRVEFKGGTITTPLHSSTTTAPDGLRIGFTPDPEIFGEATFKFPLLAQASREIAYVRHTTVEVREVTSGTVFRTEASAR